MKKVSYFSFVFSFISLAVVGGIFTFRLINSFLENIFLPCLNVTILKDHHFKHIDNLFNRNNNTKNVRTNIKFGVGAFLKEFIIWFIVVSVLYTIVPKNKPFVNK